MGDTGDVCETTGNYRSACRCKSIVRVVRGSRFSTCPNCAFDVGWGIVYEGEPPLFVDESLPDETKKAG
jgi:hypothetical protein